MVGWKIVRSPIGDDVPVARLLYGQDVRVSLREMGAASVHCVATSPPYWGLRSYLDAEDENKSLEIGSEPTIEGYVEHMLELFEELKRVLRKDGTVWLDLGDSYAGGGRAGKNPEYQRRHTSFGKLDYVSSIGGMGHPMPIPSGLKPKDMVGVPWRVAFALQSAGWYLRAACPWIKRNVMPESCTDRPSSTVEYLFLLAHPESKGKYYYDIHGSRVLLAESSQNNSSAGDTRQRRSMDWFFESLDTGLLKNESGEPLAFVVNPAPYAGAHFACWPPKLVEPCILSSTSAHGCCPACGAPWVRVVDRDGAKSVCGPKASQKQAQGLQTAFSGYADKTPVATFTTRGWEPGCHCEGNDGSMRSVVLDPFSGSGTTGMVALKSGRDYVGLDLNRDYEALAEARILDIEPPTVLSDADKTVLDMLGSSE